MRSRRAFLKIATLGAAALAVPAAGPAATPTRKKPAATPATGIEAEIKKQKQSTADLLKTIRKFELPPGSEMAFVFSPVRPRRSKNPRGSVTGGADS